MRELSLFTGAGGGVLGSKILGWKTVGYVEYEKYCQEVIRQRIQDGILDAAPIFGDINRFISGGFANAYSGLVDILTAGFPCQPFSVAGKGLGENDPRNMWPSTIECVRIIKPKICFFENVTGLFANPYFGKILDDLEAAGYTVKEPKIISAYEVGADIMRERLWVFAYDPSQRMDVLQVQQGKFDEVKIQYAEKNASFMDAAEAQLMADGMGVREPYAVAEIMEPIKAIGNGQVPLCMAYAFSILSQGIIE